jgi:hypothetical protein
VSITQNTNYLEEVTAGRGWRRPAMTGLGSFVPE